MELGASVLTRRDRLERIASAERDRRSGRIELAVASLGEGSEWPARVVLALARLPEGQGDETRVTLEASLDAWAGEAGLGPLAVESLDSEEIPLATLASDHPGSSETPSEWNADSDAQPEARPIRPAVPEFAGDLTAPIESFELDAAFAQAEAQVDEMHDVNQLAERVLRDESVGLAELLGEGLDFDASVPHPRQPELPNQTGAAWAEAPVWPTPEAAEGAQDFDVFAIEPEADGSPGRLDAAHTETSDEPDAGNPSRKVVLSTLDRWLGNLETHSARKAQ
jgi:hypothetical protein